MPGGDTPHPKAPWRSAPLWLPCEINHPQYPNRGPGAQLVLGECRILSRHRWARSGAGAAAWACIRCTTRRPLCAALEVLVYLALLFIVAARYSAAIPPDSGDPSLVCLGLLILRSLSGALHLPSHHILGRDLPVLLCGLGASDYQYLVTATRRPTTTVLLSV